jgi:CRP-like cAMP-binding protein
MKGASMPKFVKVEEYQAQIAKIPIFSYLAEKELKKLIRSADVIIYEDGEKIVTQGDLSEYFFGIIKGEVDVSTRNKHKNVFIYSIGAGEIFGETAVFMAEKRTAHVTSSGDTVVVRIHRNEIVSLIKHHPLIGNRFLILIIYSLLKKLRASTEEIAGSKNVFMDRKDIHKKIKRFLK